MQKGPAEGVRTDLIRAADLGSDGPGAKGERGGGGIPPEQSSAAAGSSEMPNPTFPWPVWTAARLWSMPVARVSHWDY